MLVSVNTSYYYQVIMGAEFIPARRFFVCPIHRERERERAPRESEEKIVCHWERFV